MSEIAPGLAPVIAIVGLFGSKGVFDPRLTNLFEPIAVTRATAHSIKILSHHRMICAWYGKITDKLVAGVAGSKSTRQATLGSNSAELLQVRHVSGHDIGSCIKTC
jgi:hypothetical protein